MNEIMLCVFVNVAFFHETVCLRALSQSVYINLLHSFNCCISTVRPGHDLFVCPINEMRNGNFLGFFLSCSKPCYREHSVPICTHLSLFFFFKYLFIYLVAPGLSCSMWDLVP